jgi:hypothetical protein
LPLAAIDLAQSGDAKPSTLWRSLPSTAIAAGEADSLPAEAAIDANIKRWFDAKQWKQRHDEIESAHAPCG